MNRCVHNVNTTQLNVRVMIHIVKPFVMPIFVMPIFVMPIFVSIWTIFHLTCKEGICPINHPLEPILMEKCKYHDLKILLHHVIDGTTLCRTVRSKKYPQLLCQVHESIKYVCPIGDFSHG